MAARAFTVLVVLIALLTVAFLLLHGGYGVSGPFTPTSTAH